jgi:hypothetical protein
MKNNTDTHVCGDMLVTNIAAPKEIDKGHPKT